MGLFRKKGKGKTLDMWELEGKRDVEGLIKAHKDSDKSARWWAVKALEKIARKAIKHPKNLRTLNGLEENYSAATKIKDCKGGLEHRIFGENMDKAEAYPWIGVTIGLMIGLLIAKIISIYINYFPYNPLEVDFYELGDIFAWVIVVVSFIFGIIGALVGGVLSGGKFWGFVAGFIAGIFILALLIILIVATFPLILGAFLGAVLGAFAGIINKKDVRTCVIAGIIAGIILFGIGWKFENEFIANIIFIILPASVGYRIGRIKKTRLDEKKRIEQKVIEYREKIEQWEREGYDVSEVRKELEELMEVEKWG